MGDHAGLPVSALPPGPAILATRSTSYRNTEHVMGWEIGDTGFTIVLSPDVPKVVIDNLRGDVDSFLAQHQLDPTQISSLDLSLRRPKAP